jgi:hypothetical protein
MRPVAVALLVCACLASSAPALAQGPDAQAHAAYERGTAAFRRGDYATAAREYAAADSLSPSAVALQAAIDAAVLADDPVLGTTLLERARGVPRTAALLTTMRTAEKKFAHRVGRVRIECPAPPCLAAIDGAATPPGDVAVVRVGAHAVTLEAAGTVVKRLVTVAPDETVVVAPEAIPVPPPGAPPPVPLASPSLPGAAPAPHSPPPPEAPSAAGGLTPVWFAVALGATAAVGGATIASGVDAAGRHSTFQSQCQSPALPPPSCHQNAIDGQSAQTRTNVLIAVTSVLGAATVATALLVRWHGASIALGPGRVSVEGTFE